MSDVTIDQLGPVDYLVVEFPANTSNFTGEMATELLTLVDGGIIRIIDMLILKKAADGGLDVVELEDIDELGELQKIEPGSPRCWRRKTSSTSPPRWSRGAPPGC